MKPYRDLIAARLAKNQRENLQSQLEARWKTVVSHAEGIIQAFKSGTPMVRFKREAAREVLKLNKSVAVADLIETVLAIYVMQDQETRRFKNEMAFRTQMVRRVRGLTPLNADAWTDKTTGKAKRVYRDLAPRTVKVLSQWLAEALGVAGLHFAKLERRDHERKQQALKDFHQALGDMQ